MSHERPNFSIYRSLYVCVDAPLEARARDASAERAHVLPWLAHTESAGAI